MHEDLKTFAGRIGLVGISQGIANFKGIFYLPLLTKSLSITDYGAWSLILASIAILHPLIQLGLNSAILRFLSPLPKEKIVQGLITVLIVVSITSTVACILFFFSSSYIVTDILKLTSITTTHAFQFAAFFIILDSINTVIISSFRVFGMIKKYAFVVLLKTFIEISLMVILIILGFGLIGAIAALMFTGIISLFTMLYFIFSYAGFARPDFSLVKPYILFGLPLIPINLAQYVIEISDRYIIGFFMGAEHVGIYSAAYGIGVIPLGLSTYLVFVLGPTVYQSYDNGLVEKAKKYLSYSMKYLLMLSIPSAFGLSILAKPILTIMTKQNFVTNGVYIIPFTVLSIVFWGIEQIFGVSLLIFKRRKIFVIAFVCSAVTNFILNIIFIPRYGIISAAFTTLVSYILLAIIIGSSSRRLFKFDLHYRFILKCIFASIGMTTCIWLINPINVVDVVLSIIFGIFVYFGLILLHKGFKKEELQMIFSIVGLTHVYQKVNAFFDSVRK